MASTISSRYLRHVTSFHVSIPFDAVFDTENWKRNDILFILAKIVMKNCKRDEFLRKIFLEFEKDT